MQLSELAILIHNLVQGTGPWHLYRSQHFNASDASAMLGCSPYQTRDELKLRLHTGLSAEVDQITQARYDNGHRIEALARPLGKEVLCDELVPMVVSRGKLSASLDGAVPFPDPEVIFFTRLWEHKQLNDALRAVMVEGATGADLPKHYRVQMEQQLMCTDAEDVLFTASDWDGDRLIEIRHVVYVSDPALRSEIITGWELLEEEMVSYVPPAGNAIVIARAFAMMPPLQFEVTGNLQVTHNLPMYKVALERVMAAAPKNATTDQEFADSEAAGKKGREIANAGKAAKVEMLRRAGPLNEAIDVMNTIVDLADDFGLSMEKMVKRRKEEVKAEMTSKARDELAAEVESLNDSLGEDLIEAVPRTVGEFGEAIKGKRNPDSMQAAVNEAKTALIIAYRQRADVLRANLAVLNPLDEKYAHLFHDRATILAKSADDFAMLVKMRCGEFDTAEAKRVEDEKQRIKASAQRQAADQIIAGHATLLRTLIDADTVLCDQAVSTLDAQVFEENTYGDHRERLVDSRDGALTKVRTLREAAVSKAAARAAAATTKPIEPPAPAPAAAPVSQPAQAEEAVVAAPATRPIFSGGGGGSRVVDFPTRTAASVQESVEVDSGKRVTVGQINDRLKAAGVQTSVALLAELGFSHVAKDKASFLYRESDLQAIGRKIAERLTEALHVKAA